MDIKNLNKAIFLDRDGTINKNVLGFIKIAQDNYNMLSIELNQKETFR